VRDVRERLQGFEYPPVELSRSGERAAAVLLPVFEEDGEARVIPAGRSIRTSTATPATPRCGRPRRRSAFLATRST
jgi:hypothetical protein